MALAKHVKNLLMYTDNEGHPIFAKIPDVCAFRYPYALDNKLMMIIN